MAASRPKRAAGLLAAARIAKGDGGQRQKRVLAMEPPAPGAPRLRGAAEAPCTGVYNLISIMDTSPLFAESDQRFRQHLSKLMVPEAQTGGNAVRSNYSLA